MMKNKSGITPLVDNCLIYVAEASLLQKGSKLVVTPEAEKRHSDAQVEATMVAMGPYAFADLKRTDPKLVPKPGDTVLIGKFEGKTYTGNDGQEYRILKEESIVGVKEKMK